MMLSAIDLSFGYRNAVIGNDVTLSVQAGEILCLIGPNGCGKTTLFKTLLGLIPRKGGSLEFEGKELSTYSRTDFARRVAYVPQANASYFSFTVMDVVMMGRASRIATFSAPAARDNAAALLALETLGIVHLADRLFTRISGGERQMVLIARALAQDPVMIIMDEPTASLDFGNQTKVLEKIGALAENGISVIMSTHDPGQAFACADRVALMSEGTVIKTGTPPEVLTASTLKDIYGVDVAVVFVEAAGHHVCTPIYTNQTEGKHP